MQVQRLIADAIRMWLMAAQCRCNTTMQLTSVSQAIAVDPVADALKDVLAAHKEAAEEQRLLCALLSSNTPFLLNAFRYYYQVCVLFS